MRYGWFRQCGLLTGSGVVEAAARRSSASASTVRHALDTGSADAITTLRRQQISGPEDRI
jgi:hypothetical protein